MDSVDELTHQRLCEFCLQRMQQYVLTVHRAVYYYVEDTNYMFPLCAELIAQIITFLFS
jgi:hypothetical protein